MHVREAILYRPIPVGNSKAAKMESKLLDGIFLGVVQRMGETIIGLADCNLGALP